MTPNIEALERLRNVLEHTDHEFNLARWRTCAAGHTKYDPWFAEHGFTVNPKLGSCGLPYYSPSPGTDFAYGFFAVQRFFGLETNDVYSIFTPREYESKRPKKATVIARIDTVISLWETEHEQAQYRSA